MKPLRIQTCVLSLFAGCLAAQSPWETLVDLDLNGCVAPNGLQTNVAWSHRRLGSGEARDPGTYVQAGAVLAANAAYAYGGLWTELQPAPFFLARLEADAFRHFGANGALLSFARAGEPYGDEVLESRQGDEETGTGSRLLLQGTPQVRLGTIVFRHQATFTWWRFKGRGPWFYEYENDTLLRDGDRILDQLTSVAWEFVGARGRAYLGPVFQTTRTREGSLARNRIGLALAWEESVPRGRWGTWRAALVAGRNQEDPNRRGKWYALVSFGTTWTLP